MIEEIGEGDRCGVRAHRSVEKIGSKFFLEEMQSRLDPAVGAALTGDPTGAGEVDVGSASL